ncbi:hypothetical protein JB92DRAFT_3138215 [Gautieria morchelliformis]|nr:hypothetical protein JB92DRAFT_3138215 [Gautieria morchelliformis]
MTNAHDTDHLLLQLNSKSQKKPLHNFQSDTRLLTAPEAQAIFEGAELERVEKEQVAAAEKAEKELVERQRNLETHHNAAFKTFDSPLTTYKLKDDLRDISMALALDNTGTIPDLVAQIKEHMDPNPALASVPCFAALYLTNCRGRKRPMVDPTPSLVPTPDAPASVHVDPAPVVGNSADIPIDPLFL